MQTHERAVGDTTWHEDPTLSPDDICIVPGIASALEIMALSRQIMEQL